MKLINTGQLMVALKIVVLILITGLTLPFYGGNTTSALNHIAFVHDCGEANKLPSESGSQTPPPARVDYNKSDVGTIAPVQVIPLPSDQPNPGPSPAPESSSIDFPMPSSGLNPETGPALNPGTNPADEGLNNPGGKPSPDPASSLDSPSNGDSLEAGEAPANAGVLLQHLLDQSYRHEDEKVAYLTFDDGPTPRLTTRILDILKEEDAKATFFTIGSNAELYPELIRRAFDEGHGIGNHTYSHVFKDIYAGPESFVDELFQTEKVLQSILGEDKTFRLTRFPGGSFGKSLKAFREAVNQAGFAFIDWNSLIGDAESVKSKSAKQLIARLKETVNNQSGLIVLMHDAPYKNTTVEALPEIIQFLKSEGYRFELLPGSR
ncbi:MAG TPA: polysaccharide deacetylase family protein [Clostridiales bacterium]|nr:polysaccharide deacetylase family protein [Clostridiales bacterium]